MKKSRGEVYIYSAVILISLVIIGSGIAMPYFKSKLLPLLVGSIVFILAVIGLWQDTRAAKEEKPGETYLFRYIIPMTWIAGLLVGIYLLGLLLSTSLFVLVYMKTHEVKWLTTIISTLATAAFIYFMFSVLLALELYPGLLFTWLAG